MRDLPPPFSSSLPLCLALQVHNSDIAGLGPEGGRPLPGAFGAVERRSTLAPRLKPSSVDSQPGSKSRLCGVKDAHINTTSTGDYPRHVEVAVRAYLTYYQVRVSIDTVPPRLTNGRRPDALIGMMACICPKLKT